HSIIRLGDWKLIYYYEDQSMELFCLKEDPMEKNNQAVSQPEKAKELYDKLSRWLKETQADIPTQLNPDYGGRK
ncbi:MAG: DUF4976 domain-containing protein, partial [Bacteroides sp.]